MMLLSWYHVVYIITKLELGGAQKVCLTLFKGLKTDHSDTTLIAGAGGVLDSSVCEERNVVLLQSLHREVSISGIISEVKAFFQLVRALRSVKKQYPQVLVHTHSTKAGLIGRWAAWCAGITVRVHTIHGFAFHEHQGWVPWLVIFCLEWLTSLITTQFICVSQKDMEQGVRLFPRFGSKAVVIRAAVAWEKFHGAVRDKESLSADRKGFIFGTVACFKPQKNLIDLLKAFELVAQKHPHALLEIVGDGEQRDFIEAWIKEHHLTDRIFLHGWVYELAPLMAQWDVFVLTSLWEGLPCAVVEARILKLPVIAYDTGGINEVIATNKNGVLHRQYEWQACAQSMGQCIADPAWYCSLMQHKDDLHAFCNTTMIAQHQKLYIKLLKCLC